MTYCADISSVDAKNNIDRGDSQHLDRLVVQRGGGSHWDGGPHPALTQSHNTGGVGMSDQELFSQGGAYLVPGVHCADTVGTLCADTHPGAYSGQDAYTGRLVVQPATAHTLRGEGHDASEDGTGRGTPLVCVLRESGQGYYVEDDVAGTVDANMGQSGSGKTRAAIVYENHGQDSRITECRDVAPTVHSKFGTGGNNVPPVLGFDTAQITSPGNYNNPKPGDPIPPLNTVAQMHVATTYFEPRCVRTTGGQPQEELAHCLRADTNTGDGQPCVAVNSTVRRLLPVETERLQNMPDGHTAITYRGKPAADGNRYKAIGNSMAVSCVEFILHNLTRQLASNPCGFEPTSGTCEMDAGTHHP